MAGRIALDLKHFKHVSSDDRSTTLQHAKDGHMLILAHQALSPENQEQLKALGASAKNAMQPVDKKMAVGGDVKKPTAAEALKKAKESNPKHGAIGHVDKDEPKSFGKIKESAQSDVKPKPFADGGGVPDALKPTEDMPQAKQPQIPAININVGGQPVQALGGQPTPAPMSNAMPAESPTKALTPEQWQALPEQDKLSFLDPMAENPGPTAASNIATKMEEMKQAANASRAQELAKAGIRPQQPPQQQQQMSAPADLPMGMPTDMPAGNPMAQGMQDSQAMMQQGYQNKLAGINQEATAKGALGQQEAQLLNNQVKAQTTAMSAYKDQYDALEKERQDHISDIQNGYIDPNKYWTGDANGNGSHSKIASAIGMIIAGFNPTSQPNAAANYLQKQMDMNIEAQKANLGAKQNLLASNLHQFGNLKDATDMTRVMQADVVHNELLSAAATAQSPMAKAAALQAAGDLKMQYAPIAQQVAMRQAMMKLASNGDPTDTAAAEQMIAYNRVTNPEVAKEMESRLIPGMGMAKVPVPESARKEIIAKQNLNTAAEDLMSYSKQNTNLVPGTAEYNHGVTKAMAFQQMVREGLLGTVFRESEKPLLEKFVKENPAGALKSITTQPQLKAIMESNQLGLNSIKQAYGLPVSKAAPQIKIVNGVKYMRGPNGQAIPVK